MLILLKSVFCAVLVEVQVFSFNTFLVMYLCLCQRKHISPWLKKRENNIVRSPTTSLSEFSVFPVTQNSTDMFYLAYMCCRGKQTEIRNLIQAGSYKVESSGV